MAKPGRKPGSPPTPGSWTKGGSRNPRGRPKELPEFKRQIREYGPEILKRTLEIMRDGDKRLSLQAAELLLAYGFGRPAVGDTDPEGGQVTTIRFVHAEAPKVV